MIYTGSPFNVAKKTTGVYVGGSDGIARKAKKIYIGDEDGIARLAWSSDYEVVYSTSQEVAIQNGVRKIDVFCVGGGGGCGGSALQATSAQSPFLLQTNYHYGSGGAGGYTATAKDVPVNAGEKLLITVGAGGGSGLSCGMIINYDSEGQASVNYTTDNESYAAISGGGTGGTTSVKKYQNNASTGSIICTARGGGGGKAASYGTWGYGERHVDGANGGTGSGAAGSYGSDTSAIYEPGSDNRKWATYNASLGSLSSIQNEPHCYGDAGSDGSDGGKLRYAHGTSTGQVLDNPSYQYGTGGSGQGSTTRKWGEADGTLYSNANVVSPRANMGDGARSKTSDSNPNGSAGVVIIKYYY